MTVIRVTDLRRGEASNLKEVQTILQYMSVYHYTCMCFIQKSFAFGELRAESRMVIALVTIQNGTEIHPIGYIRPE